MNKLVKRFLVVAMSLAGASCSALQEKDGAMNVLCKTAFERYPFGVIFSKTAPSDIKTINFDTDFCYFYFSPGIEQRSKLKRIAMCTGTINAKRDFPDYKGYFEDDAKVMESYIDGKVLAFCEPWAPPGISSYIYTRKTALVAKNASYMLGCFDLVDDVTLGIASFKVVAHNAAAELSPMSTIQISDEWFKDAFDALPNGLALVQEDGMILRSNQQWKKATVGDGKTTSEEDVVVTINQLFKEHGFVPSAATLLTSAAWLTTKLFNDQLYDIGTYGIMHENKAVQVIVLRPTMSSVAVPFWQAKYIL